MHMFGHIYIRKFIRIYMEILCITMYEHTPMFLLSTFVTDTCTQKRAKFWSESLSRIHARTYTCAHFFLPTMFVKITNAHIRQDSLGHGHIKIVSSQFALVVSAKTTHAKNARTHTHTHTQTIDSRVTVRPTPNPECKKPRDDLNQLWVDSIGTHTLIYTRIRQSTDIQTNTCTHTRLTCSSSS